MYILIKKMFKINEGYQWFTRKVLLQYAAM
jgi:hypothetical protein